MNTFIKILGSLAVIVGVWATFIGIFIGIDTESSVGVIAGGGLFMALGITAFVFYKD